MLVHGLVLRPEDRGNEKCAICDQQDAELGTTIIAITQLPMLNGRVAHSQQFARPPGRHTRSLPSARAPSVFRMVA